MMDILVVEDERIERETLVHIVKNHIALCEHVYEARNGMEALELYTRHHPKIVCADINMPGMSGLEMIKKMKEENFDTQFLMVSSYNYFEYAQEAIRLGAVDFILKPYNIAEFIEAIQKVVNRIQEHPINEFQAHTAKDRKPQYIQDTLYAIITDVPEIELYRKMKRMDISAQSGFCMLYHSDDYEAYKEKIKNIAQALKCLLIQDIMHGSLVSFILCEHYMNRDHRIQISNIIKEYVNENDEIGIGYIVNDVSKFHSSFLQAKEHLDKKRPLSKQFLLSPCNVDNTLLYKTTENLFACFEHMDEESLKKEMKSLCDTLLLQEQNDILSLLQQIYHDLLHKIQKSFPDVDTSDVKLQTLPTSVNFYQDLGINVNLNIKKMYLKVKEARFKNTNHFVKEALSYIEENYDKPITLNNVSTYLKASPFYISKLLSTSTCKTFTELVAMKRIEKSKVLLKGDTPIKEIAFKVGFQGQSYYNKIFKKYTGMTPKLYRDEMKP